MQRVVTPELLDSDEGSTHEIAASLADLRRINRWFGSISTICNLVKKIAEQSSRRRFTMLDVGGASGDIAAAAQQRLRSSGIDLQTTLLDRASSHMNGNFPATAGDALHLPFRAKAFDLVACSTFMHHLDSDEIIRFVNEALRVARVAVLINDLRRHPLHLALVYAGFPLFRSRLTRHDGPASVRRAYTPQELLDLLKLTAASRIQISNHYLFRMGVIVWA